MWLRVGVGAGSRVRVIDICEEGGEEGGLQSGDFGLVEGGDGRGLDDEGLGLDGGVERANGSVSSSIPPRLSSPTP